MDVDIDSQAPVPPGREPFAPDVPVCDGMQAAWTCLKSSVTPACCLYPSSYSSTTKMSESTTPITVGLMGTVGDLCELH